MNLHLGNIVSVLRSLVAGLQSNGKCKILDKTESVERVIQQDANGQVSKVLFFYKTTVNAPRAPFGGDKRLLQ